MPNIVIAAFARDESNVTLEEFKSAVQAVHLAAMQDSLDFAAKVVIGGITQLQPEFRTHYPWVRIRAKKSDVMAIVELRRETQEIMVIAVMRKNIFAYDIFPLWTRRKSGR